MKPTPAEIAAHERRLAARREHGLKVLAREGERMVNAGHHPGCQSAFIGEPCNCGAES